ncbi:MAG: hypothetical protein ABR924_07240 [Terracidiphilus sp.]|jgi:hypothetical protein
MKLPVTFSGRRGSSLLTVSAVLRRLLVTAATAAIAVGCFSAAPAQAQQTAQAGANSLDGNWANVDPKTSGLVEIDIDGKKVHPYGVCHPTACDLGVIKAKSFASSVNSTEVGKLVAKKSLQFDDLTIALSLEADGRLRAETFTHYTSHIGRADFSAAEYFTRSQRPPGAPIYLKAPSRAQQSPQAGTNSLDGDWVNVDPRTRGIVEIVIAGKKVHPYGACHPNPCDWGGIEVRNSASSAGVPDSGRLVLDVNTGLSQVGITLSLQPDGRLRAETGTRYTDGSGRAYFSAVDYLTQSQRAASPPMNRNTQSGGTQEYHIEVTAIFGWRNGSVGRATDHLALGTLDVSVGSFKVPVRISRPLSAKDIAKRGFPPHLLVIFPLDKPRPGDGDGDVVQTLSRALSKGWLVSASRSDGSFTPYCNDAATLESALAATGAASLSPEDAESAAQTATAGLEKFSGRRVLLIANGTNKYPYMFPYGWLSEEQGKLGRIYVVDGGVTAPGGTSDTWPAYDIPPFQIRRYDRGLGLVHELKFSDAVRDVLHDGRNYYDVEFSMPSSLSESILPITLTLHNGGDRPVTNAELYSVAPPTASGTSVVERVTVPRRLIVAWK